MRKKKSDRRGTSAGEMVLLCAAALLMTTGGIYFWARVFFRPHGCGGQLTACKCNLKNLGTGLEMYASDFNGYYPASLSQLTPNYLKTIPRCPATGSDTYSASYTHENEPGQPRAWCLGHQYFSEPPCGNYWRRVVREAELFRDKHGRLPDSLEEMKLEPALIRCPYGGGRLFYSSNVGHYWIDCHGQNHSNYRLPADRPGYDDVQGLVER